jgi:hypothetical protein
MVFLPSTKDRYTMLHKSIAAAMAVQARFLVWESGPRWKHIALIFLLSCTLGGVPTHGNATGLDCPDIGSVSNLLTDGQAKLMASGSSIDLANEIDDLINKLQSERPQVAQEYDPAGARGVGRTRSGSPNRL